jgi:hypothetical protein
MLRARLLPALALLAALWAAATGGDLVWPNG